MAFIDYYKILGVQKDIPQKDVKKAYLKRAKQFHPDLHPDDPKAKAKFQALTEAYDVINDPDKRAKYDKYGEQWKEAGCFDAHQNRGYAGYGTGSPFEGFDFSNFGGGGRFSSFFETLFGQGGRFSGYGQQSPANEGEMNASVSIDMYTALLGGEVIVQLGNAQKVRLKVKPVTQPGTKVRLKGKGHPLKNGTCGDLIITYQVEFPKALNERQKQLLAEMRNG